MLDKALALLEAEHYANPQPSAATCSSCFVLDSGVQDADAKSEGNTEVGRPHSAGNATE